MKTAPLHYGHTKKASYLGYVTQAIVNNLSPLLFLTFQQQFQVSIKQLAFLISINFLIQLVVDLLASLFVDKIGWRICVVSAHVLATLGLIGMGVFPFLFPSPFMGLLAAVALNAIGGGLIEVLISPIVEAIPGDKKTSEMAFLHSFYCWGHVAVVLLSTLYFMTIGIQNWRFLPIIWAIVPLVNSILFTKVPLAPLVQEHENTMSLKDLFSRKLFWLVIVMMICSGAAEQAMSQWSSYFAEVGLRVGKTMGDLLGPLTFALLMGLSRLLYGLYGHKLNLEKTLISMSVLCIASYFLAVFSPFPILSLVGCGITGFSVGLFWPGVTSISSKYFRRGGTAMFAILALAGDLGCASGPGVVGLASDNVLRGGFARITQWFNGSDPSIAALKIGLLFATVFAVVLLLGLLVLHTRSKAQKG